MLVGERVLARGVKDEDRCFADYSSDVAVMDGIHALAQTANADLAEADVVARFDDTVNISALLLLRLRLSVKLPDCGSVDGLQAVDFLPRRFFLRPRGRRARLLLRCCFGGVHTLLLKVYRSS